MILGLDFIMSTKQQLDKLLIKNLMEREQPQISDDTNDLERIFKEMREGLKTGQTKSLKFRQKALENLLEGYEKMRPEIQQALNKDLGLNPFMCNVGAHSLVIKEIQDLKDNLQAWSRPQKVETPLVLGVASSSVEYEPLGLVMVISAWNYPIYTALPQVAAGISAGNSVILKPSEMAPYSSIVLNRLFQKYLDKRYYRCIQGKVNVAKKLTSLPFDLICFTGSTQTGRLVAIEAAKNLTPCLLELGGKCPAIVDQTADIDSAVSRIIFGKFFNCGQTCVGVDHVFVHESKVKIFEQKLLIKIEEGFGNDLETTVREGNYGKIINAHHFNRLKKYLNQDDHRGKFLLQGKTDEDKLTIMPTVIQSPHPDSSLMRQEIFGPILPIIPYHDINNVINEIKQRPKPLAIYLFTESNKIAKQFKERTSSGAFVMNDSIVQIMNWNLPFGGVGKSGWGRYHGKAGFVAFSNLKSVVMTQAFNMYPLNTRFAPYTEHKKKMLTFLLKVGGVTYGQLGKRLGIVALAITSAIIGLKMREKL